MQYLLKTNPVSDMVQEPGKYAVISPSLAGFRIDRMVWFGTYKSTRTKKIKDFELQSDAILITDDDIDVDCTKIVDELFVKENLEKVKKAKHDESIKEIILQIEKEQAEKAEEEHKLWLKKNKWNLEYDKLAEFWKKNGHSSVPEDHELYEWSEAQRNNKRLAKAKRAKLDEIDFVWDTSIDEKHKIWIDQIHRISKKRGGFQAKKGDINNFLRLCMYRKEKGMLPQGLKHAFDQRGIILE